MGRENTTSVMLVPNSMKDHEILLLIYHQHDLTVDLGGVRLLKSFSIAVVLPARAERTWFNFCYRCLISERFLSAFVCARTRLEVKLHFNFVGVPARLQ